ncbi:MAG: RnfABCDGE type electron transport complex subunit B [Clostridia bacterium]|nr:RnfABCDGE type electron transport complex subunit B [Clostridia bacterium]
MIAFLVVAAIGLVAGILLALISHFFGVEEDETVKAVRACLPGANCGACGYKGCDDYAVALAEGRAAPNLCIPGGEATAEELGTVLRVEIVPPKNVAAFVHCAGNCSVTEQRADYEGMQTCRAASMLFGGPESCRFGCLGLGDCMKACPSDAICMKDGIAHVDPTRCTGCGLCAATCPKGIISVIPKATPAAVVLCSNKDKGADARKVCKSACIGCKKCEKTCALEAIKVVDQLAQINYDTCTGCGACAEACPVGCLDTLIPR